MCGYKDFIMYIVINLLTAANIGIMKQVLNKRLSSEVSFVKKMFSANYVLKAQSLKIFYINKKNKIKEHCKMVITQNNGMLFHRHFHPIPSSCLTLKMLFSSNTPYKFYGYFCMALFLLRST